MGIAPVGPGIDFGTLSRPISLRQHSGKRIQVSLDLLKIRIRDLSPFRFEWRLELYPKGVELFLVHVALLSRVNNYSVDRTPLLRPIGLTQPLPSSDTVVVGHARVATNGNSGAEAAETGESDARERGRECCARDETVDVAQYVVCHFTGLREKSQRNGDRGRL